MSSETLAMLGMGGATMSAVFAATGFIISNAVKFGRWVQRQEQVEERVEVVDKKVERHLEWHEDERQSAHAE